MDNIQTLEGKFENLLDLQSYANSQYQVIQKQNELIARLQSEVAQLKSLLSSTVVADEKLSKFVVSTEQTICEIEIARLKETAIQRGLTLEETKRLDLLVKNLVLSKEQTKEAKPDYSKLASISNATLIEIASQPEAVEDA
jgi:hypothetical protein